MAKIIQIFFEGNNEMNFVMSPEICPPCSRPHESDPPNGTADDGGGAPLIWYARGLLRPPIYNKNKLRYTHYCSNVADLTRSSNISSHVYRWKGVEKTSLGVR